MQEVNHKELSQIIHKSYNKKIPLFVYGGFGIGKSTVVSETAREIAEEKGKEFVRWNQVSKERKNEMLENPQDYFVLMDIRLAQLDPSDLKGIPNLEQNGAVEWKPPLWVYFASKENADGVIFFDESNLAPPSVQSAFYQVVHDREVGSYSISENIGMVSAGNRLEDQSNVYDMSEALKDRYLEIELVPPSIEDWTDWAMENGIDSRIISYLQFKRPHIHKPQMDSENKSTTPRGWERLSDMIEDVEDIETVRKLAGSSIGEGVATEFRSFIKLKQEIDLDKFKNNPERVEIPTDLDMKYSLVSGLVDWYSHNRSEEKLEKLTILADRLDPEYGILMLRLAKNEGERYFKNHIRNCSRWSNLSDEFRKYLL